MAHKVAQYALPAGIFLARDGQSFLFMDVSNDSYFSLPERFSAAMERLRNNRLDAIDEEMDELIGILVSNGLLSEVYGVDSDIIPVGKHLAYTESRDMAILEREPIGFGQFYALGKSYLKARRLLCSGGIGPGVAYLQRRRRIRQASHLDTAELYQLATAFHRLKPLFFSRRGNCLLNSLVLLLFLDYYGIRGTWCFGVKADPFQAHCWVRVNENLVDDQICSVHRFSLIAEI